MKKHGIPHRRGRGGAWGRGGISVTNFPKNKKALLPDGINGSIGDGSSDVRSSIGGIRGSREWGNLPIAVGIWYKWSGWGRGGDRFKP